MSHRATCLDNAACETVFSKLKAAIGPDTSYHNQEELSQAINEWIHFYNERRTQTKLGNQTPLQYEQNLVAYKNIYSLLKQEHTGSNFKGTRHKVSPPPKKKFLMKDWL